MKTSETLSSSNLRILRNGKTVNPGKKTMIKKKSMLNMTNGNQLTFPKTSQSDLCTLHVENKNNPNEMLLTSACDHLLGNSDLCILLNKLSWPVINDIKDTLDDQTNNSTNKNCYKNLENYIQLNELQIYNELEPKKERKSELVQTKTTISSSYLINKNGIKTETNTNSVANKNIDVRITRGKSTKLQIEERKQLDQIIFNKFPDNTFKMFAIELDDISEEAKFLRTLGLTCRFKSPLSTLKLKKKH